LGPAPGTPDGWLFDVVRLGTQDVAHNGTVLLHGGVIENLDVAFRNPSEPGYTDGAWKRLPGGELELVALSGTIAPGTDRRFRSVAGGQINSRGEVAVIAYLEGGVEPSSGEGGVWTDLGGGGLRKVLAVGDQAPGLPVGFVMTGQGNPRALISESGKIAMRMHAESGGASLSGIWEEGTNGLQPVALDGDQAPGAEQGRVFQGINAHYMNEAGQIAFTARMTGGNPEYRFSHGIWAQDRQGVLHLVVKVGDYLEVAPGVFSEVDYLNFSTSSSYADPVINNRGQIVFHATFTDGTQAIVVSDVVAIPEPSSWTLAVGLGILGVGAVRLRKRRIDSTIAQ
jgi:hypothetical protein